MLELMEAMEFAPCDSLERRLGQYLEQCGHRSTSEKRAVESIDALYDVTFTAGCAAGGSMEVHGDREVVASGLTAAYDIWIKAEFGPACGDLKMY